jgi:two-component system chemotaxis response regulator CheB
MWELSDAGAPRFRCHVGHAYSMHSLASEQSSRVEAALRAATRGLEESERLHRRLAGDAGQRGNRTSEALHHENAEASRAHVNVLRDMLGHREPSGPTVTRGPKPQK